MSDINVTVSTAPILVAAQTTTNTIQASVLGIQGVAGVQGAEGVAGTGVVSFDNVVFTSGVQTISGIKTFNNVTVFTDVLSGNNHYINIAQGIINGNWNADFLKLSGQNITTGSVVKYNVFATSGLDTEFITYPSVMPYKPIIKIDFESARDPLLYSHIISGVNTNGFYINYSDFLTNSGYKLHITLNL